MDEVTCPYCGEENKINHDDGAFYNENEQEEMDCHYCDKTFIVYTSVIYYHEGAICPCKNGEPHAWKPIHGYPTQYYVGKDRCDFCGEERDSLTKEERQELMNKYFEEIRSKDPILPPVVELTKE